MYKKHSLILLPTDEASQIHIADGELVIGKLCQNTIHYQYQHLYILRDDEISKSDWYISKHTGIPLQASENHIRKFKDDKKIIATTNNNISINLGKEKWVAPTNSKNDMVYTRLCPFPNIPFLFVQHYIEQYNLGNVITEVEIEYDLYCTHHNEILIPNKIINTHSGGGHICEGVEKIKINSSDNTISIKPLKNSWTKEEVRLLICKYAKENGKGWLNIDNMTTDKWIEQNL